MKRRSFLQLIGAIGATPALAWSGEQRQAEATTIPLIKRDGVYYVQVTINGNAAALLLLVDTGATVTLLNHKFANLAVGGAPSSDVRGVGASVKARIVPIHLQIGPRAFATDAVIGDFQIPGADGSLGCDVLADCGKITLDFANKTMLLYSK